MRSRRPAPVLCAQDDRKIQSVVAVGVHGRSVRTDNAMQLFVRYSSLALLKEPAQAL